MIVGVPKEIKEEEYRVAITPAGVRSFVEAGHKVVIEKNAGAGSYISDAEFQVAGAEILPNIKAVYKMADMILKVKEPLEPEYALIRKGQLLFTYLHLAADEKLTRLLLKSGATGVAYETVVLPDCTLPLLRPMSEVAGKMAVQVGCQFLEKRRGGRGILISGVPGVPPGDVVIIGGGVVGLCAAQVAVGLGAQVTILDVSTKVLRHVDEYMLGRVITIKSTPQAVEKAVSYADLVVGAVLVTGAKAPKVVTKAMVKKMKPGSVIVDVAIDQGGCIETSRLTTHTNPTFVVNGVVHYCVGNMPGAVPRTSTLALTNETLPYALELANKGFDRAVRENPALAAGVNIHDGKCMYAGVASAFGLKLHNIF